MFFSMLCDFRVARDPGSSMQQQIRWPGQRKLKKRDNNGLLKHKIHGGQNYHDSNVPNEMILNDPVFRSQKYTTSRRLPRYKTSSSNGPSESSPPLPSDLLAGLELGIGPILVFRPDSSVDRFEFSLVEMAECRSLEEVDCSVAVDCDPSFQQNGGRLLTESASALKCGRSGLDSSPGKHMASPTSATSIPP